MNDILNGTGKIIGIMATTSSGVIGRDGAMPWRYEDEMRFFRQITDGSVIVMGRKTYESLPASLFVTRSAVVFSRDTAFAAQNALKPCRVYHDVNAFIDDMYALKIAHAHRKIFMIGGAQIFDLFVRKELLALLLLTEIEEEHCGDVMIDRSLICDWRRRLLRRTADYSIFALRPAKKTADICDFL